MIDAEILFIVANGVALLGWVLLVFAPLWPATARLLSAVLIPGLLAIAYAVLIVSQSGKGEGSLASLAELHLAFANPYMLLVGWIHYLVFDLFIGAWQCRDAQREGIRHVYILPSLTLTCLVGPIGLLSYLILRGALRRKLAIVQS
jgi:hypothetical protein